MMLLLPLLASGPRPSGPDDPSFWVGGVYAFFGLALTIVYGDGVRTTGGSFLPNASDLDHELSAAAITLARRLFTRRVRIRSLTLQAERLRYAAWQRDLFFRDPRLKWREVYSAVDKVRAKFGQTAAVLATGPGR